MWTEGSRFWISHSPLSALLSCGGGIQKGCLENILFLSTSRPHMCAEELVKEDKEATQAKELLAVVSVIGRADTRCGGE